MSYLLLLIGLVGFLGMTWLFPVLGRLLWKFQTSSATSASANPLPGKLAILIPAHNEAHTLPDTLTSIAQAIAEARREFPELDVSVVVGADACSDNSAQVAAHHGARVIQFPDGRRKWHTVAELVRAVDDVDWIALVDSGITWDPSFLRTVLPICGDAEVMGVAPAYENPSGGSIERTLWSIERHFKSLESRAGGPISVHGATVLYRYAELRSALGQLEGESWLNDDVVVPLVLRTENPSKRIAYLPTLSVVDGPQRKAGIETNGWELGRRLRMMKGNVQWMRNLYLTAVRSNPVVGVLALRRIFRVFWIYWGLSLVLATCFFIATHVGEVSVLVACAVVVLLFSITGRMVLPLRRIADAGRASLVAPVYLTTTDNFARVVWK